MTVYIDSYILYSFCINYLLLAVTNKILNLKGKKLRIFFGSISATIYGVCIFIPHTKYVYGFIGKLIFSFLIIVISFKFRSVKEYLRTLITFYVTTFIFGGCAYAVMNYINTEKTFLIKIIVISTFISYTIMDIFSRFYKKTVVRNNNSFVVKILYNDKVSEFYGLLDTGNCLTDPMSGKPVMVVELNKLKEILPEVIINGYEKNMDITDIMLLSESNLLRLIPFNSVGESKGIIGAFMPDKVFINEKEVSCIIGIYHNAIAKDGVYSALINPVIM